MKKDELKKLVKECVKEVLEEAPKNTKYVKQYNNLSKEIQKDLNNLLKMIKEHKIGFDDEIKNPLKPGDRDYYMGFNVEAQTDNLIEFKRKLKKITDWF